MGVIVVSSQLGMMKDVMDLFLGKKIKILYLDFFMQVSFGLVNYDIWCLYMGYMG